MKGWFREAELSLALVVAELFGHWSQIPYLVRDCWARTRRSYCTAWWVYRLRRRILVRTVQVLDHSGHYGGAQLSSSSTVVLDPDRTGKKYDLQPPGE